MKQLLLLLFASLLVFSTTCGPDDTNTIRIGLIVPITGDVKTFGESVRNAVLIAVDEANQKGGINGKTIRVITADDKNDPTEAANACSKLINQNKVKFIIGSVASKASIPISEMCEQAKVLMITPTSTNPRVTVRDNGERKEYVFRACFIDPFQGTVAAKFASENLKAKRAAILYDISNDYVKGLAEFFKESFTQMGGQVTIYESYGKDDVDFSALLTKIKADNPDVLFIPDYYTKVGLIAKQTRAIGIKSVLLGGDGWDSPEMTKIAGDAINGGYFTNHYSPQDPRAEVQEWVSKYETKFGQKPDALGTLGYDATLLLLEAMRNAESEKVEDVRDALTKLTNFQTVSGQITFDAFGNPVKNAVILQYMDGEQRYVTTVQP
ncbi:MAG: ABC transporter substrate-binding protein [Candidatus Latescibacteria bacterium]|nr:ABC transporter substrate-binding protein [Candidatus Latescibacterota bacterium]